MNSLWVQVFAGLKAHLLSTCTVRVSYLEIYNEQCYDLLDISAQPSDIAIIEDSKDRVIVKGLAAPVVNNEAEALQHLFEVGQSPLWFVRGGTVPVACSPMCCFRVAFAYAKHLQLSQCHARAVSTCAICKYKGRTVLRC